MQPRIGGMPFRGAEQPMEVGAWLGLAEPRPIDALSLAFFSDALIPAPFMRLTSRAPRPTIDLTIHFRVALPAPARARPERAVPGAQCARGSSTKASSRRTA